MMSLSASPCRFRSNPWTLQGCPGGLATWPQPSPRPAVRHRLPRWAHLSLPPRAGRPAWTTTPSGLCASPPDDGAALARWPPGLVGGCGPGEEKEAGEARRAPPRGRARARRGGHARQVAAGGLSGTSVPQPQPGRGRRAGLTEPR